MGGGYSCAKTGQPTASAAMAHDQGPGTGARSRSDAQFSSGSSGSAHLEGRKMKALIHAVALLLAFAGADAIGATKTVNVGGYTTGGGDYYGGGTDTPVYAFNPS